MASDNYNAEAHSDFHAGVGPMPSLFDNHPRKIAAASGLTGAAMALAVTLVGGFEGKRNYTYFDIVGVPTYCYGGTGSAAVIGAKFTNEQCDAQLSADLQTHWRDMVRCAPALEKVSDNEKASFVSFGYNVGGSAFCRSSIPAKLASGQRNSACRTILRYDRAGGKVIKGLTIRRRAEFTLCEKGLTT